MSDYSIKLEVGKSYIARDGAVFGPMVLDDGSSYPYVSLNKSWRADGKYWWDGALSPFDLMREYVEPQPQVEKANDPVNNPSHYASGAVECINAIQASMSVEAFRGYCKGNVQKYVWRYETKGEVESLRKAEWYLKRLISTFETAAVQHHSV